MAFGWSWWLIGKHNRPGRPLGGPGRAFDDLDGPFDDLDGPFG